MGWHSSEILPPEIGPLSSVQAAPELFEEFCTVCHRAIVTQAHKGTGTCCIICGKYENGELTDEEKKEWRRWIFEHLECNVCPICKRTNRYQTGDDTEPICYHVWHEGGRN